MNKTTERLREEFIESFQEHYFEEGKPDRVADVFAAEGDGVPSTVWEWINKNYISKEEHNERKELAYMRGQNATVELITQYAKVLHNDLAI